MMLENFTEKGWPSSKEVPDILKPFYSFRDYITCIDGVLFYMDRVFIPELEREKVLREVHEGHQGETKCIRRAAEVIWWPGMSRDIREMVKECIKCEEFRRKPREPLLSTPLPEKPWWRIAIDLFEKDGLNYLVVVDYYSRYISVHELKDSTDARTIVSELEKLFCMIGVPNTIVSDNGPQFIAEIFERFVNKWDIEHITSAPKFPQSNGEAERAVQTVKNLMRKSLNLQAALCAYRDTPLANGYSPSQLLFNRSMNSMGIMSGKQVDVGRLRNFERIQREKQTFNYNRRHTASDRSPLKIEQHVVVREPQKKPSPAVVVATQGREVVVENQQHNLIRRNRSQIARAQSRSADEGDIVNFSSEGTENSQVLQDQVEQRPKDRIEQTSSSPDKIVQPTDISQEQLIQGSPPTRRSKGVSRSKEASTRIPQSPVATAIAVTRTRSGRVSKPVQKLNL